MFKEMTHDKSYFLGFFSADGNIYKNTISIQIQEKDDYILKKFNQLFINNGYNPSLELKKRMILYSDGPHYYSRIRINSKELSNELISFGFGKNKTYNIKFPKIQDEFMPDYLRGFFDGDGSINERRKYLEVSLVSASEDFLKDFSSFISKKLNFSSKNLYKYQGKGHSPLYKITFYSLEANRFCSYIYNSNSNFCLKRKKDKFLNYTFILCPRMWTKEEIQFLKDNYVPGKSGTTKKIAIALNRTIKAVQLKAFKLNLGKTKA